MNSCQRNQGYQKTWSARRIQTFVKHASRPLLQNMTVDCSYNSRQKLRHPWPSDNVETQKLSHTEGRKITSTLTKCSRPCRHITKHGSFHILLVIKTFKYNYCLPLLAALFTQNLFVQKGQRCYESCHSFLLISLSLGRGAGARSSAARHCGGALSTAAPPSAPLLPRARAGARHDVVLHWYGTLGLSDTAHVESGELSCGAHLAPAEFRLQTVDGSPAIQYMDPIPAATLHAAPETAIRHVVPVSAVTYTSPAPVIE